MQQIAIEAKERMDKSVSTLKDSLATLRTGRASVSLLNGIEIDYYGSMTPINQISSISSPEPKQLVIKPYDKNDIKSIVAALNASNLGLNPINEGTSVRLIFPPLTEERRKEISKQARKFGEDSKVAVRNIRRDFMEKAKKDSSLTEDLEKACEEDIQKVTDESCKLIDSLVAEKEKEIMSM